MTKDHKKAEAELERLRTDSKLANAEKRSLEKDNKDLQNLVNDFTQSEQDYLTRIQELELQIVIVQKDTSKNMMSRIKELETMLAVEKRKVNSMQPVSIISETVGVSSITSKTAANTETKKRKKRTG